MSYTTKPAYSKPVNRQTTKRRRDDNSDDDTDGDNECEEKKPKRARIAQNRSGRDTRRNNQDVSREHRSTSDDNGVRPPPRPFNFRYTGLRGAGPQHIETDVDWMRRWMLLSSPLFYTFPHHDAAGLVTWTTLLSGMKLWSYIVPKNPESKPEAAARQYVELIKAMNHISIDTENKLPELAVSHNFFLSPNTLL